MLNWSARFESPLCTREYPWSTQCSARFGFHPFGDPWEVKRHHDDRKKQQTPAQPNAPDIPDGTYTGSCEGCALVDQQARACRSASVPRALARQCSAQLSLACAFASIAPCADALAHARRNRRPGPTTRMSVCGIGHGRQSGRPQHAPAVSCASCRTSCRARCCAARTARPARAGLPSRPSAWARALPKRSARLVAAPSAGAVPDCVRRLN